MSDMYISPVARVEHLLSSGCGASENPSAIEQRVIGRRQAELELYRAKRAAELANLAKSEFLATMCHEIRNPVSVMIGMMELALQTNLTAEQREYLNLMKTSSGSLLNVINDSLDLAKIEAGCIETENIPFSLRDSLGDAMKMLAFEAQRKGLVLAYDIAPEVPDALCGDPMRLRQIVINLLSNAIKFTEQGDVVMRVECEGIGGGEVICRFAIADSGPGIPLDKQASIFDPFVQAQASTSRRYGGTGLGLAISARLVQLMNGTMWLESEPDKGSTFLFTACFCLQTASSTVGKPLDCKGLLALVVEKHPDSRRFLVNTLRQWNMEVHEADSGQSALARIVQARAAQAPYRLVLLDDGLCDVDSHAVAAQLLKNDWTPEVRVVLLGSSPWKKDGDSYHIAAPLICLTMPVKQSELLAIAASMTCDPEERGTENRTLAGSTVASATRTPRSGLSILLVDDEPLNRRLAQLVLEKEGCRVRMANSAAEALEMLAHERFDLALMDVQMPKMDGAEMTMAIRRREKITGGHLPVIALTANVMARDREYCLQAGMDGYLTKPIQPESMFEVIERLRAAGVAQSDEVRPGDPVLDRCALLVSVNGDRQLLVEIVDLFLNNCGKLMTGARDALDKRDEDGFYHVLHTMLGMFRSLYAYAAQEVAERLHELSVDREPDRAEAIYAQLEKEVSALKDALVSLSRETWTRRLVGKPRHRRFAAANNGRKPVSWPAASVMTMEASSLRYPHRGNCK